MKSKQRKWSLWVYMKRMENSQWKCCCILQGSTWGWPFPACYPNSSPGQSKDNAYVTLFIFAVHGRKQNRTRSNWNIGPFASLQHEEEKEKEPATGVALHLAPCFASVLFGRWRARPLPQNIGGVPKGLSPQELAPLPHRCLMAFTCISQAAILSIMEKVDCRYELIVENLQLCMSVEYKTET